MTGPIDIGMIVSRLTDRIDGLCETLLPQGVRVGPEWRVGSIAGEAGRSMGVHLKGAQAGIWCDFGGPPDHRGDALDLVAQVLFRGDKKQALRWSRAWLGLDQVDPASIATARRQAVEKKAKAKTDEQRKQGNAQRLFLQGHASLIGTLTYEYLLGRGIDLARLRRQPGSLRDHQGLVHPETGEITPGMVAAITGPDNRFQGVHRTFLERGRDQLVRKLAGVVDAKLTLGHYPGGCIRLWRGGTLKPLHQAEAGEWIVVGEGIEDTLTAVMAAPEIRACCAVSLAAMGSLWLPPAIEGVIILAQNGDGPQAQAALERAIKHFHETGKRVKLARPPPGVKDVNDMVRESAR